MRKPALVLVLAALVAAVNLSACTSDEPPIGDRPKDLTARVFLSTDATKAQTRAIKARLRGTPDIVGLTFITREVAYEKMKADLKDSPKLIEAVRSDQVPESYEFRLPNRAVFERTYQGSLRGDLRQLEGFESIVFRGRKTQASVGECVMAIRTAPETAPILDISVFLSKETSPAERQAIESRLRAVPGAGEVRLRSREEGYEILKRTYQDVKPEIASSAKPEDLSEVLVLTMVDHPSVFRANDARVDEQLCRMVGVDRVIVPLKPL